MEGVDYNTHYSPRLEQVPPKISEYTAKQNLQTRSWMVWSERGMEMAKDDVKKSKDVDRVDLNSVDLPDLHGEHVGMELHVGAVRRETVMVDNTAYHDGGSWVVDKWWPIEKDDDTFKNNNINTNKHQNDKDISVVKLKMTNLVTS